MIPPFFGCHLLNRPLPDSGCSAFSGYGGSEPVTNGEYSGAGRAGADKEDEEPTGAPIGPPATASGGRPGELGAPAGRALERCTWIRVRSTSCGYVANEATIFEKAEHPRIAVGVNGCPSRAASQYASRGIEHRARCAPLEAVSDAGRWGYQAPQRNSPAHDLLFSYSPNWTATCDTPNKLGRRPL